MTRPPFALVAVVTLLSCGGAPDAEIDDISQNTQLEVALADGVDALDDDALAATDENGEAADLDGRAGEADDDLPRGAFADLETLCARQMTLAAPRLREARELFEDRGYDDFDSAPACREDREALALAQVSAGGPFAEISAITFVTPEAVATHLVARTRLGWILVETPVTLAFHYDPGCPSMLRDSGLVEARVAGERTPTLVLETSADRMTFDEEEKEEEDLVGGGGSTAIFTQAVACHLDERAAAITCSDPLAISESVRSPSGKVRELSRTTYVVDGRGELEITGDDCLDAQ
jgi:hypothetical protein